MRDTIVNLIAIRLKSTRLARKALLEIEGKPMLWHLVDRVSRAQRPSVTVVCTSNLTDDDPIADTCRKYGFALFRGSPENVLQRFLDAANSFRADHIVRITGDNPLTDPVLIDGMCSEHLDHAADYTYTEDTPRGTRPEIISASALQLCLELAQDPRFSEYMTLYFRDYPQVFKHHRFSCVDERFRRPWYSVTVDTPEDFAIVSEIYSACFHKDPKFTLVQVNAFLDAHSQFVSSMSKRPELDRSKINTRLRLPPR